MSDEPLASRSLPASGSNTVAPRTRAAIERLASLGASVQSAIPGLYAWAVTVAPAAWSRGATPLAKVFALVGVVLLGTAPFVEGRWMGPTWARAWSVWGLVLPSAIVWALTPAALSSARLDGVRGALGMVGWALFAFASAGPALREDSRTASRMTASTSLKPRSAVRRGDGIYIGFGVLLALSMQAIGWGIVVPERAVLVRLVTVICGIAVLGGATNLALARHSPPSAPWTRLKRALPWLVLLVVFTIWGSMMGISP